MNKYRKIFLLLLGCLLFQGCAPSIKYTGKSYPATDNIEVFTSDKEIKRPYEIIGTLEGYRKSSGDFNEMMEKIKKEAKLHGADAVVISGIQVVGGKAGDSTEAKSYNELVNQALVGSHTKLNYDTQTNQPMNVMQFNCIKYK
ncbi:MAG: hypothetical protein ACHQEM_03825 [Chitinophagales bacterium]